MPHAPLLNLVAQGDRENDLTHRWPPREALAHCDEGRGCEPSRRLTFLVLCTHDGRPGTWLFLVAGLWALVAATTLGSVG